MQVFSVDEGFADMTTSYKLFGPDPYTVAVLIKDRIRDELGFTVSIGISSNKLLAKQARSGISAPLTLLKLLDKLQL